MQSEILGLVMSAWQLCLDIIEAEGTMTENLIFFNVYKVVMPSNPLNFHLLGILGYLLPGYTAGLKSQLLLPVTQGMSMENTSYPRCSSTELIQFFHELQAVFIVISHITYINHDFLGK